MLRTFRTRITTRVVALSATAAVLLGLALTVLIVAITDQRDAARTAFASQEVLAAGVQLESTLITIENGLRGYVASGQRQLLEPTTAALRSYPAQRSALVRLVSRDPRQQERVARIGEEIQDYVNLWAAPVIRLATDDLAVARSQLLTKTGSERQNEIRSQFARLFDSERAVIRSREQRAEASSKRAIAFGIGGLALVVLIAVGFTTYLRRSVVRPVLGVAEATGRLASGDLSTRVETDREDEIGDLARGFNSMADSLECGRVDLERSNAELQRSNAELEQFASVTSHDLQAPLTTISMYSELLGRRIAANVDGTPELLGGIRDATQQARTLIRDLLDYSRAGRGTITLEQVGAGVVVSQALEALAGAIEESGASVTVSELPTVLADRGNLCRVFQNLVGNAVKFSGARAPSVSIEAERDDGQWRFAVRDNGIGMQPEHSERIFEPFQRLHGEEDYPGTGIGLAVCERIIDQHGGRIWVSSSPGEGSVFFFTLPVVEPARVPVGA